MKLTPNIQKAIERASVLHFTQRRKGSGLPYIVHPFSVAFILSSYTEDEDVIIAALFHDVLEDVKDYSFENMKRDFGKRVAQIVREVSEDQKLKDQEDKKATWQERKEKYLKNMEKDSKEALMITAADKINNLNSIVEDYKRMRELVWEKFNASKEQTMWYYESILSVLKERLPGDLSEELDILYKEAKKTVF